MSDTYQANSSNIIGSIRDKIWNYPYVLTNISSRITRFKNFFIVILVFAAMYISYSKVYSLIRNQQGINTGLSIGITNLTDQYNPLSSNTLSRTINRLVFNTLFNLDNQNNPTASLASSWDFNSSHTIVYFNLRKDILWGDKAKFTSDDVIYSFNIQKTLNANDLFARYKIARTGTYSFQIETPGVDQNIWQRLLFPIIPAHTIYSKYEGIGTGPYILQKHSNQDYYFTANSLNFNGVPKIRTIILKVFKNQSDLYDAYKSGEINSFLITDPESSIGSDLINDHSSNIFQRPLIADYNALFFNLNSIKDLNIRKGINYAIKRSRINSILVGYDQLIDGPINPGSWAYSNDTSINRYNYSAENALESFKNAGFAMTSQGLLLNSEGKTLDTSISYEKSFAQLSVINSIVSDLQEIGVHVKLIPYTEEQWNKSIIEEKDFDIAYVHVQEDIDPDLIGLWSTVGKSNLSSYSDSNVDNFLNLGRTTIYTDERKKAYFLFQKNIMKQSPAAFLYSPDIIFVTRPNITKVKVDNNIAFDVDILNNINTWSMKN